jgi:hypothetical protein
MKHYLAKTIEYSLYKYLLFFLFIILYLLILPLLVINIINSHKFITYFKDYDLIIDYLKTKHWFNYMDDSDNNRTVNRIETGNNRIIVPENNGSENIIITSNNTIEIVPRNNNPTSVNTSNFSASPLTLISNNIERNNIPTISNVLQISVNESNSQTSIIKSIIITVTILNP